MRLDVSKKRKDMEISAIPRFEAASVAIAPPTATATEDFVNKRIKTSSRATAVPKMEYSSLEEGNPFLEIEHDSDLLHKVILQMALISEGKETKRTVVEPVSPVISEGFYWRDYPILEEILFDNMKNYYNMSSQNRQSRHQQEFNNRLVSSIRDAARENGYQFHPSFNDKRLRDRIRCFYKTHLQNAKKRVSTDFVPGKIFRAPQLIPLLFVAVGNASKASELSYSPVSFAHLHSLCQAKYERGR